MSVQTNDPRLIALDWGTSSLRAYLLGPSAAILAENSLSAGIMQIKRSGFGAGLGAAFEKAFEQACGSWLGATPSLPILASGMIGSAQGWREAHYLNVPVDMFEVGNHLTQLKTSTGKRIHIVPGLVRRGKLVNVMRGEETQILGALIACGPSVDLRKVLIGLPGTHTKWARVSGTAVEDFETFMTGEVYAALCEHTILGCTMKPTSSFHAEAFDRGLRIAQGAIGQMGVLSNIFSVRTFALTDGLSAEEQGDYLSGLLIGHEINTLRAFHDEGDASSLEPLPILLIGQPHLCMRYQRALEFNSYKRVIVIADATIRGLWQIAVQASLVAQTTVSPMTPAERPGLC